MFTILIAAGVVVLLISLYAILEMGARADADYERARAIDESLKRARLEVKRRVER